MIKNEPLEGHQDPWSEPRPHCLRCGAPIDTPYCSQCGQKKARRLTVAGPLQALSRHVFSFDSALGKTLIDLTRRPGHAIRRYIAGDRNSYINPAKYAFLAATLYALVITGLKVDVRPHQWQLDDPRALTTMRFVVGILGYLIFIYMLPVAAIMRACFRKAGYNFAETYTALLFYAGHYLLTLSLLAAAGIFSWQWGFLAVRVAGFGILVFFVSGLYQESSLRTWLSSLVVYAVIVLGGVLSGLAAVTIMVLWKSGWTWS